MPEDRNIYRYTLVGLSPTDTIVFKAMVRMLPGDLAEQWVYEASGHALRWASVCFAQVNLWVIDAEVWWQWGKQCSKPDSNKQVLVVNGDQQEQGVRSLSKPLTMDGLTQAFKEISDELRQTAAQSLNAKSANQAHASWLDEPIKRFQTIEHFDRVDGSPSVEVANQVRSTQLHGQRYRLIRWPQHQYLNTPAAVRIATALTGRAMSLNDLALMSRHDLSVCSALVEKFLHAGLIQTTAADQLDSTPQTSDALVRPAKKQGLLSLIRMRLGL